jgi:biopolymer transport protein TolR
MGVQLTGRSRNNRNGRRHTTLKSEINITPLVDIMLVLLIIFMITSPMLVSGVNVDLPETKASPLAGQDEPLVISIDKQGDIYLLGTKIARETLAEKLIAVAQEKKDVRIFVQGDKNVPYGDILSVVAEVQQAGFNKVALNSKIKNNEK